MSRSWLDLAPQAAAARMRSAGLRRAWIAWDEETQRPLVSTPLLGELGAFLSASPADYRRHEAIFLEVGPSSGTLFGAFVHSCIRGQAQGGLRNWHYERLDDFLRDGLRLSLGMGRKSALAGLWWGGGKGIIARPEGEAGDDRDKRRTLYAEYGRFVTSLRGCYVTAEDAGTSPLDLAEIARHTRFATCVPPAIGGSGNPAAMTALGVVEAMEAAQAHIGRESLAGCRIAMQGAGHVGSSMLERLFEKDVASIAVSELSEERCAALGEFFAGRPLEVRHALPGDDSILAEPCDILVPNALGGVLNPKTIRDLDTRIVCGAANNQLEHDDRDAELLRARGITYVPDYVANRMGIVACCNEHAGSLPRDPAVLAHLDRNNPGSIYRVTRRVLARADERSESPVVSANALADERMLEPHPIHGDRARRIVAALVDGAWAL